jgi:hypothetical protein
MEWIWKTVTGAFGPRQEELSVDEIWVYPVKSCAGVRMASGRLVETGLEFDRCWVIVDAETRKFITQRAFPAMALIQPSLTATELVLTAPGRTALHIPLENNTDRPSITVHVWKDAVGGFAEGSEASDWLSDFFNRRVLLVRKDPERTRQLEEGFVDASHYGYEPQTAFSDGYPLLIVTAASIKDIRERVQLADPASAVTARNFRPNIVIGGSSVPFVEDA